MFYNKNYFQNIMNKIRANYKCCVYNFPTTPMQQKGKILIRLIIKMS